MFFINSRKKKYVLLTVTVMWSLFIFYMSSQPAAESSAASSVFVDAIIKYLNIDMKFIKAVTMAVRKTAHFSEYFILACLVTNTYKAFKGKVINYSFTLLVCLVQANLDEFLQKFINGRSSEVRDVLIDFAGAITFTVIFALRKRIKNIKNEKIRA